MQFSHFNNFYLDFFNFAKVKLPMTNDKFALIEAMKVIKFMVEKNAFSGIFTVISQLLAALACKYVFFAHTHT